MTDGLPDNADRGRVLVTGATGYIGGRLVPHLLEQGWRVRCLVRSARKLERRTWAAHPRLEVVEGDASDEATIDRAMVDCDAAYYLIHSMMVAGSEYRDEDQRLARLFATAAARANLKQIIYLGGLGETGADLSEHLTSRREVEGVLREGTVPVTTLRAAMIIGSGSASFEILRYLVERLPVMITPKWVSTENQPIAVRNVIHYLAECLNIPETIGRTLDIGGPDVMTYRALMQVMAAERGLPRRIVIPVPVLTPRLSSLWIHLVTPLSSRIARPLAEGLRNRVVCAEDDARHLMPQRLLSVRESIAEALGQLDAHDIETSWSDAGPIPGDPDWAGGTVFTDRRDVQVAATPEAVHAAACRIGGGEGYYAASWLWRLRGIMDRLVGGPGLRRGRRDPETVGYGEALDFWRVTGIEPGRLLELRAEMKLPGVATLTFEIEPAGTERSKLTQTARFKPKGLFGLLYWYAVLPMHGFVFSGMVRGIARSAERRALHADAGEPLGDDTGGLAPDS
ncbi:MAG: SDR family oxidoreductase [Phycisphaerales bacterium]|nr:SDR family oxidoreductase [Phycisphaerales bacterium]